MMTSKGRTALTASVHQRRSSRSEQSARLWSAEVPGIDLEPDSIVARWSVWATLGMLLIAVAYTGHVEVASTDSADYTLASSSNPPASLGEETVTGAPVFQIRMRLPQSVVSRIHEGTVIRLPDRFGHPIATRVLFVNGSQIEATLTLVTVASSPILASPHGRALIVTNAASLLTRLLPKRTRR